MRAVRALRRVMLYFRLRRAWLLKKSESERTPASRASRVSRVVVLFM